MRYLQVKKTSDCTELDQFQSYDVASSSGTDSDDEAGESEKEPDGKSEKEPDGADCSKSQRCIILTKYGSEERNFYDENGYLYSINNNSTATKSYYF